MRKPHRTVLLGSGVLAAAVAAAGFAILPAEAATAGVARVFNARTVDFNALTGQTNKVTVTLSGRTVTIDDVVALNPGKGCKRVGSDRTKVACTTSTTPTLLRAALGDLNDTFVNKGALGVAVSAGAGNDTIFGGAKDDALYAENGNDAVLGGGGVDHLFGDGGNDSLNGGPGDDLLFGGSGDDALGGAEGNDLGDGGLGADLFAGGAGEVDLAAYGDRTRQVKVDLDGARGDDGQYGEKDSILADVEGVLGGEGADILTGNAKNNGLLGGSGGDTLRGGAGHDDIIGDLGNDTLAGDAGDDYLWGEEWSTTGTVGSDAATDRVDGGDNTPAGDACFVLAAGTTVNCENTGDAPASGARANRKFDAAPSAAAVHADQLKRMAQVRAAARPALASAPR